MLENTFQDIRGDEIARILLVEVIRNGFGGAVDVSLMFAIALFQFGFPPAPFGEGQIDEIVCFLPRDLAIMVRTKIGNGKGLELFQAFQILDGVGIHG